MTTGQDTDTTTALATAEARIRRLGQLYATLSECNAAIIRCGDRQRLADAVCQAAVTLGGFRMAWVGMVDPATRFVVPIAASGAGTSYLDGITISTDPATPSGQGPTGASIHHDAPQWCDDFQHDPRTAPWHTRGAEVGWTASAALPLRSGGHPIGALTLYAGVDTVKFDDDSRTLLEQIAAQVSFAFDSYDREAARRRVEDDLRLQSAALNAAIDGIIITDASGIIVWANHAAIAMSGYSREELIGHSVELQRSEVQPQEFHEAFWKQIRSGHAWSGEFVNRRKDGSLYTESTTITPVLADDGRLSHYIAVKRDVSEQKQQQERLLHAQKLELVGRIAGNIAHDFNNLLGVINGTADLAAMTLPDEAEVKKDLETIRQAGDRAAVLTRQLLMFSRQHVIVARVVDLHQVLRAFHEMVVRIIPEHIRIDLRTLAARPSIRIDPIQIEQIVLNLIINARDAMPDGGTLTIATSDDDSSVTLHVTDTGTGIAPDVRPHIFEPFFTTKDPSIGTGLGLSTVLDIVTNSHGTIAVDSTPGQGSTFSITWPRASADRCVPNR